MYILLGKLLLWLDVSLGVLSDWGPIVVIACGLVQCKICDTCT